MHGQFDEFEFAEDLDFEDRPVKHRSRELSREISRKRRQQKISRMRDLQDDDDLYDYDFDDYSELDSEVFDRYLANDNRY